MFENVDLYCERLDSSFWAEPINALTNIAFLLAAWLIWRRSHKLQIFSFDVQLLIALIASIGIGSGLFHTFATTWARIIDILPILLFQLSYLYFYLRRFTQIHFLSILGILTLYIILAIIARQYPAILNGSLIYTPVFVMLTILGIFHITTQKNEPYMLLAALGIFILSITFRTLDMLVCPYFPTGIHFMWHILNSITVYLLMRGYMANIPRSHYYT